MERRQLGRGRAPLRAGRRALSRADVASGGFGDVDATGEVDRFVAYLDEQSAHPFFRKRKRAGLEALGLRPGDRVLDVGCGTGDDVRDLARLVGPEGVAVGVDASEALVGEARRRHSDRANLEFHAADAGALPFPGESFHAVRIERTLQHLAQPSAAVSELVRVSRNGARVTAFEPDWRLFAIDAEPEEISRAVCDRWRSRIRQPDIGGRLQALFRAAGLSIDRAETHALEVDDFGFADRQYDLSRLAGSDSWPSGTFHASVTYIFVAGRKGAHGHV